MSKHRLYDIARELNITNKELLGKVIGMGIEAKSHSSSINEDEYKKVMGAFKGGNVQEKEKKQEAKPKPASAAKPANVEKPANPAKTAKSKKPLPEGYKRDEQGRLVRPDGTIVPPRPLPEGYKRDEQGRLVRPDGTIVPPRPKSEGNKRDSQGRPLRPDGTIAPPRKPLPEGYKRDEQGRLVRPDGSIVQRPENRGQRPDRPPRPYGDRPPRPQGDRPPRLQGDRPPRPYGDRPPRPQGDRPPRPQGDRPPRPQGDRPYGDRPPRPYGDRPPRPQGDRPPRPQGDRPPRPQGDRPPRPGGDRQFRPAQGQGQGQGGRFGGGGRPGGGFGRPAAGFDKSSAKVETPNKSERQQNLEARKSFNKRDRPIVDSDSQGNVRGGRNQRGRTAQPQRPEKKSLVALETKQITIPSSLTLKELAEKMGVSGAELVKSLLKKGQVIAINSEITYDLAADIALQYNVIAEELIEVDIFEDTFSEEPEDETLKKARPPVVVVMGHVDHGKTSLLDAIRKTNVTKGEQGGITQHIGAYQTSINDKLITFLDTPGHEAFTAMRMRGVQVTDVAVLVVAADDGVMPQTAEAISHAREAGVEIIVAINKIDKPDANPDRVKQELMKYELVVEEFGGQTICAEVSAKRDDGIEHLLEMITLAAELKELKANPDKRARGVVIEANLDNKRGPVATVLVQEGTIYIGDHVVSGLSYGKVRALIDATGKRVKKASPSMPVEILGLPKVPAAGDMFYIAKDEKTARMVADVSYARGRREMNKNVAKVSLDDLFNQIQAGKVKELNLIIKGDVQGSVEAIRTSLTRLSNDEVKVKTILVNVGAITESDVSLAAASNAIIIGFNVRPEAAAKSMAEEQGVDIRLYRIIYNAIEDIEKAMKGLLDPVFEEKILGKAELREIFKASGIGNIGGAYIQEGKFIRSASVRIIRDGIVIHEGALDSLRRFKDDVREVNAGYECGLVFHRFNDIKVGDIVEAFTMEEVER